MPRRDKCGILRRDTWVPPYRKRDIEDAVPYNGTGAVQENTEIGAAEAAPFCISGRAGRIWRRWLPKNGSG